MRNVLSSDTRNSRVCSSGWADQSGPDLLEAEKEQPADSEDDGGRAIAIGVGEVELDQEGEESGDVVDLILGCVGVVCRSNDVKFVADKSWAWMAEVV